MISDEIGELAKALVAAQAEFPNIRKTEEGKITGTSKTGSSYDYSYKYADMASVVETVQPILAKHKLAVSQFISHRFHDGKSIDTLTTYLLHESGQYMSDVMQLHLTKDDAQGQGSAITYGRRYSYMAALGLVADDDDDGNKASTPTVAIPSTTEPKRYPYKPPVAESPPVVDDNGFLPVQTSIPTSPILEDTTITKLGNALKLKGFTDKLEIIRFLNTLSRGRYGHNDFRYMTEAQAKELTTWISAPPQTHDVLTGMIEPF